MDSSSVTLELLEETRIPGVDQLPTGIQLFHLDKPISRLTKLRFVLTNSGNKIIRKSDIVVVPTLRFQATSSVLAAEIDRVEPPGVMAGVAIANNTAAIRFPLLNPGDKIRFSVSVSGERVRFQPATRIAGIDQLRFVDRREQKRAGLGFQDIDWTHYVVTIGTVLGFFLLFDVIKTIGSHERMMRVWGSGAVAIPALSEADQLSPFLERLGLSAYPNQPIAAMRDYHDEQCKKFADWYRENSDQLYGLVEKKIRDDISSARRRSVALVAMILIGLSYLTLGLVDAFLL